MVFRGVSPRAGAVWALLGGALALAGCQSDNAADALDLSPRAGQVNQSELRAFCPPITLHEGTSRYGVYERGARDDPARLQYQASISDVTRTCSYSGGLTTVTVAVAGRIVPGPRGQVGTVQLPIRVVLLQGGQVDPNHTSTQQYAVQVTDTVGATQFIYNRSSITFPTGSTNVQLLAGYDEGPPPRRR